MSFPKADYPWFCCFQARGTLFNLKFVVGSVLQELCVQIIGEIFQTKLFGTQFHEFHEDSYESSMRNNKNGFWLRTFIHGIEKFLKQEF